MAIANGADQNVDGFLSISPDDFGQWASVGFGGGGDIFNPPGPLLPLEATFTSAFFLAVPSRTQHIVLTENASYTGIADDGSLNLSITSPLAASDDHGGDGVDDTLTSSFTATGTDTDLAFDVTQVLTSGDPGVAMMTQTYFITNNSGLAVDFTLARVQDCDMVWDGAADFASDQVGTTTNAAGGELFVVQHEVDDPVATAVTISSPEAISYFGGKQGIEPVGGPPAYNFGTDTTVFDNFGIPASWANNIAGVGNDTDGDSIGGTATGDGFIGLGFSVSLGPGESTSVSVTTTFGQAFPTPIVPPVPVIEIPTLGATGLLILAAIIALLAGLVMRRRSSSMI